MAFTEKEKIVFLRKGKEVENEFSKIFKNAVSTTTEEDIRDHVDIKINVGVDVKGLKKINRNDETSNEHFHWVEIMNVLGLSGWLYGKADFFAFEIKDYWVVVSKEDLQKFTAEKCKEKIWVNKPELYKLYRRSGRKDIITLITSYDLCFIATSMIKK